MKATVTLQRGGHNLPHILKPQKLLRLVQPQTRLLPQTLYPKAWVPRLKAFHPLQKVHH